MLNKLLIYYAYAYFYFLIMNGCGVKIIYITNITY